MRTFLKSYGFAMLCGAALAVSFPTWSIFPLAWVALVPLFYRTYGLTGRETFKQFLVAGWVFNSILLQWLMTNLYWAGGWAFWGYQLLCLFMALYWGIAGLTWSWMRRRASWAGGAISLCVLWAGMEFLQSRLFSGFGWGAVAYSQGNDAALQQLAAIGGAPLVSAIVVLFNGLIALAIAEKGRLRLARTLSAVVVLGLSHGVGIYLLGEPDYASKPMKVGLIQANFPLEMKWDPEYSEEMVRNMAEKSWSIAEDNSVDLFVWPEDAVTDKITSPGISELVASLTKDTGAALFTGSDRPTGESGGEFNSSCLIDSQGKIVDYYDKVHLAPFGEYVPFEKFLPFVQQVVPAISDIEAGNELKVLPAAGRMFGPLICFEVLFAHLAEELRDKGADYIIVITNLGWFGNSNAIPQELEIARMRAIETRLPLVHCANTGISGVFDPWGRFAMVNGEFDLSGNHVPFSQIVAPKDTIMHRVAGALPVAAPGPRPVTYGPRIFPWLALVASCGLVGIAALTPARHADRNTQRHTKKRRH